MGVTTAAAENMYSRYHECGYIKWQQMHT